MTWNQAEFEDILAEWIVACDQPFNQVDHPAFHALLNYVHLHARKALSIPGRTTIRKRIMKLGEDTIQSMQTMFRVCYPFHFSWATLLTHSQDLDCKISISLDAWTSPNQYAFLAIIAHYVTNEGKHGMFFALLSYCASHGLTIITEEVVIDFKELVGEHSGENMAEVVWSTLKLYKIENKVRTIVMLWLLPQFLTSSISSWPLLWTTRRTMTPCSEQLSVDAMK